MNPRCKAKGKRSGEQCTNKAMNGQEVCRMHGGSAPQARRKAAERIAQAELLAQAKADPALADMSPPEMLLAAAQDTARVVTMLRATGAGSTPEPATLDLFGQWLDRLTKAASVVVSSKADELAIAREQRVASGQARQLAEVMSLTMNALALTPAQQARVPAALESALASLGLIPDPVTPTMHAKDSSGRLPMLELTAEPDPEDLL